MPRQIRIEYAGAIYHVMSRGDRREAIVLGDEDRELWVRTLGEACRKTGWQVDAYCLMTNHFHLVMETPQPNLVAGMKWFLGTYTIRFNTRHRLRGHLFAGRYKSVLVDGSDSEYLRVACDYVHLNPARARLIQEEERLERYSWSSYPAYLRGAAARPVWLRTDRLLGEHGTEEDNRRGRLEFSRRMESERLRVNDPESNDPPWLKRGWRLGGEAFLARLMDRLDGKTSESHFAQERLDVAEVKAQKIIEAGLKELGWTENDLRECNKSAPQKVQLARRLRAETTLTLKRVAQRLNMGSWRSVSKLLYQPSHDFPED